ncbi:Retrovirus-related Pol polyprotein from transposon [Trichinella pseudospiralis]|uniref:Retrovirus-related Pol polyprotein from transposon n=1 Tax=Trichinella pseudospiralis TaxID=6337 RepID=A0A0V0XU80_TRIPS|nr:Retrovirus-related Pol polyprotein from transposon [Trichinella pseudospiralis]
MLQSGVTEPASGVWSSPVVLVQKKDVSHQFCVDNCKLIEYRILRIDDTLDALPRLKWFSTLDLASGYWQLEVVECDREKPASASCTSRLDREEDTATMQVTGTRGQPMDEEPMRPARHNSPAGEDYMSLVGDP